MGHGKEFAAYYYNRGHEWGKDVVINYKHDAFQFECTGSGNPHRIAGCNKNICGLVNIMKEGENKMEKQIKKLTLSAMFTASGIVLPMITGNIAAFCINTDEEFNI